MLQVFLFSHYCTANVIHLKNTIMEEKSLPSLIWKQQATNQGII